MLTKVDIFEAALQRCHIAPQLCGHDRAVPYVDYDLRGLNELEQVAGLMFIISAWPGLPTCVVEQPGAAADFCAADERDSFFVQALSQEHVSIRGPFSPYVAQLTPQPMVFWTALLGEQLCRIWVRLDSVEFLYPALERVAPQMQPLDFENPLSPERGTWRVWRKNQDAHELQLQPMAAWEEQLLRDFGAAGFDDGGWQLVFQLRDGLLYASHRENEFSVWAEAPQIVGDLVKKHHRQLQESRQKQRALFYAVEGYLRELASDFSTLAQEAHFPAALSKYLSLLTGYHVPVRRVMEPASVIGGTERQLIVEVELLDDYLQTVRQLIAVPLQGDGVLRSFSLALNAV